MHLNPNIWWYIARASGLVAWGLLAATVFWGLIFAGRLSHKVPPPAWSLDLHRFLGALSVIFVAVHIIGLSADRYVNFGLSQLLVPFASRWRPGSVAWGITALYLLIAVELTSLTMRWIPRRLWRQVHLLSFVLFVFATIHSIQSGTDTANWLVRTLGVALIALAAVTAVLRVVQAGRRRAAKARPRPVSMTVAPAPQAPEDPVARRADPPPPHPIPVRTNGVVRYERTARQAVNPYP